jgi:Phosphotransferase enzyme family
MAHDRPRLVLDDLEMHPAFIAWTEVDSAACPPKEIEVLKPEIRKSAVFRLKGIKGAPPTVIAKRRHGGDLDLEVQILRELLPSLSLHSLEVYAYLRRENDYSWMFIEDAGENWYSPELSEHQSAAMNWMVSLHRGCSVESLTLPDTGVTYFRGVLDASRDLVTESINHSALNPSDVGVLTSILGHLEKIERSWSQVESAAASIRESIAHGDFVPKNVRARNRHGRVELLVFDWETAGIAPPAVDIALLPGDEALLRAYHDSMREEWPELRWTDLLRAQKVGELFRLLHAVSWQARSFRHAWLGRAMSNMTCYEEYLRKSIGEM